MVNISSLPVPSVLQTLSYEDVLQNNIANLQTLLPDWQPIESDDYMLLLEAFAYRELYLRAEFNTLAKAFFLSTTSGSDLDNYGVFYGVERLQGSKPYADYTFTLSATQTQDVVIPKGLVLTDVTNTYTAEVLQNITIPAGTLSGIGDVELQLNISASTIKTEVITTPLPFVVTASANADFANGKDDENDESYLNRILISYANTSTAGSEESYKSYTFGADSRIEDVAVENGGAGIVNVYYYSPQADDLMQQRIVEALNATDVRPLTDTVNVEKATEVSYSITAELKILPNQETATVYANAVDNLNSSLASLKKMGDEITLSEINEFLMVDGVKEVIISSPTDNIAINPNEIGVNGDNTITFTVI
jgi:phage-related baseplate assembly protein